ncbi:MAG TPA: aminotransferase class V-fold PLP-dependent enzyme [Polyangiaceae bacterium]|nr:aminotransferase class V-fold PLP-dependent enzyme [Polyangiaceae bacterium]
MTRPGVPSPLAAHWTLDPAIDFLNHGSFGACPKVVLEAQQRWRARLELEPVSFILRELPGLLDEARDVLAQFVGASAEDIAFVNNTTTGVNTVLRSLEFAAGDELLTTDHTYNACRNALEYVAARTGARVVVADVPFPLHSPDEVVTAVLANVTERTRLALLDHITSPTALIFPIEELVSKLNARNVDTLVDGAHAPGMVPLNLDALGAAYYTGNCHKWLCAPKGSALLHVRRDRQALIRPLVLSHGMNTPNGDRSLFRREFDYQGTQDPTPFLCVVDAIRFLEGVLEGGLASVISVNHALALQARNTLCNRLGIAPPAPDSMIGAMASLPLSNVPPSLQDDLFHQDQIEVPVLPWPSGRCLRVTAQLYNTADQYERLAEALLRRLT